MSRFGGFARITDPRGSVKLLCSVAPQASFALLSLETKSASYMQATSAIDFTAKLEERHLLLASPGSSASTFVDVKLEDLTGLEKKASPGLVDLHACMSLRLSMAARGDLSICSPWLSKGEGSFRCWAPSGLPESA